MNRELLSLFSITGNMMIGAKHIFDKICEWILIASVFYNKYVYRFVHSVGFRVVHSFRPFLSVGVVFCWERMRQMSSLSIVSVVAPFSSISPNELLDFLWSL